MAEENEFKEKDGLQPSAPVSCYTANGVLIVPSLRVRIIAIGHECETNVGTPAFDHGGLVRVVMVRGHKLMEPKELVAV